MDKTVPCFADLLSAVEKGFRWAPEYRLYVRVMRDLNAFRVDVYPPTSDLPSYDESKEAPLPWWESTESPLSFMPALNKYQARTTSCTFYVDRDGREIHGYSA